METLSRISKRLTCGRIQANINRQPCDDIVLLKTQRRCLVFAFNAAPWCSGLTYWPVKPEIAGSNPVGVATSLLLFFFSVHTGVFGAADIVVAVPSVVLPAKMPLTKS